MVCLHVMSKSTSKFKIMPMVTDTLTSRMDVESIFLINVIVEIDVTILSLRVNGPLHIHKCKRMPFGVYKAHALPTLNWPIFFSES